MITGRESQTATAQLAKLTAEQPGASSATGYKVGGTAALVVPLAFASAAGAVRIRRKCYLRDGFSVLPAFIIMGAGQGDRRGTEVKYAERPLLGISASVETLVKDTLLRWLSY